MPNRTRTCKEVPIWAKHQREERIDVPNGNFFERFCVPEANRPSRITCRDYFSLWDESGGNRCSRLGFLQLANGFALLNIPQPDRVPKTAD